MKRVLPLVFLLVFACAPTKVSLHVDCASTTTALFDKLEKIMVSHDMEITYRNDELGKLKSQSEMFTGTTMSSKYQNRWTINVEVLEAKPNSPSKTGEVSSKRVETKVVALAEQFNQEGIYQIVHQIGDEGTYSSWLWYWDVRNALEEECGHRIVFVKP